MEKLPSETKHGLTWLDQDYLQKEIAKAETITQSEIIIGVARRSSNYDFIALLLALAVTFVMSIGLLYMKLWPFSYLSLQLIQICATIGLQTFIVKGGLAVGFVPKVHTHRAAHRMARDMFYDYELQATHNRNALLIFVSLQERMMILLPDKALRQIVPFQVWDELVQQTVQQRGSQNVAMWLGHAIRNCAKTLQQYDPATGDNPDEISNAIRFV